VRVLIDEGVPVQIERVLIGHVCTTVQKAGWGSYTNGALLAKAEGVYNLFITADKNLKYQQNLADRQIAILELSTNRRRTIDRNFDRIIATVESIQPGEFISLALE
jgi:hypothetical protein